MARKLKSNNVFCPKKTKAIVIKGGLPIEHASVCPSKSMTNPTVVLVSRDQVSIEVHVDELMAMESCLINNMLKREVDESSLQCKAHVFLKVIEFCKKHADIRNNSDEKLAHEMLKDFHSQFVKENHSIIIDLLSASCRMQIKSLLDVTSEAVTDMIDGKTTEEIHKMFNLNEGLTDKELEVVFYYDKFCFESLK